jgi:dTMP kinase
VRGRVIAFEGVDGAGKSTAIARVADTLRARGVRVFMPRTGKDHASRPVRAIRDLTRDRRHLTLEPTAELLLYCAREAQVLAELVRPALARGETVLIDRSLLTPEVLGRARGLSEASCAQAAAAAAAGLEPDLTIVFDVHPRTSRLRKQLARIRTHSDERGGRKGLAGSAFKARVRDAYGVLALERGFPVLRCERASPEELARRALLLIDHGAQAATGQSALDRVPQWLVSPELDLHAGLERVPVSCALLLGSNLIATRALRARVWVEEPALCAYTLDAADPLREQLTELEPSYALRGLSGRPLEDEDDLRIRLMARAPDACLTALKHVASVRADALRELSTEERPSAVMASLSGRSDVRALALRARCAARADDRALASGLQQCDDEDAWRLREALLERDPAYGLRSLRGLRGARVDTLLERYADAAPSLVLEALGGRSDAMAYRLRERLGTDAHELLESLRGLDDHAAWALRERTVERDPVGAAHSLLGMPLDARAQALVERCLRAGAGDLHVLRRLEALREQDDAPEWIKARRRRASMEMDE